MAKTEKVLEKEHNRVKEENQRSGVGKALLSSVLMLGLGILLLFKPDFGSHLLTTILGWVLIGAGVIGLGTCILSWPVMGYGQVLLSVGLAAFGIFVLIRGDLLEQIVFLAMGIYLVLQSGGNMIEAFKLKKLGYNSIPSLILMGALLVLGLLMIFAHTIVRGWVMLLLGGFLVACGLSNLIFRTLAVRKLRQPKTANVVDADE